MKNNKIMWYIILLLDIFLFIIALRSNIFFFNFISIILSIIIYKFGSPILFKEFNENKKAKEIKMEQIKAANREVILNLHNNRRNK